jgi:hypothetical protein
MKINVVCDSECEIGGVCGTKGRQERVIQGSSG